MPLSDSVQEVLDRARQAYLNDKDAITFTNTVLLPILKEAYDQFQSQLQLNNLQLTNSIAEIPVPAGSLTLSQPGDFMYPVNLEERDLTSTDPADYVAMEQMTWEPSRQQSTNLLQWVYRNGDVKFIGATTARKVKLYYQSAFPTIQDGLSLVKGNSISYLAAKTAAIAHLFINQNETLAEQANSIAQQQMREVVQIAVKRTQSLWARRRPYRPFWRF